MYTIDRFPSSAAPSTVFARWCAPGVKSLALSHPADSRAERDALIPFAHDACQKYGVKLYPEDEPFLTDLFPVSLNRGKFNILFYRADHVIEEYIRLKERKAALLRAGAYFGGNRTQLATSYGRLLSYTDDAVRRLLAENGREGADLGAIVPAILLDRRAAVWYSKQVV